MGGGGGVKVVKAAHKEIQYRCFTRFGKDAILFDLVHSQLPLVYTSIQTPMKLLSFGANRLVLFIISTLLL